jgi:hypothetical protein
VLNGDFDVGMRFCFLWMFCGCTGLILPLMISPPPPAQPLLQAW